MRHSWRLLRTLLFLPLAGCGTVPPSLQEDRASPVDGILMSQAIVESIHCEMVKSLKNIWNDKLIKKSNPSVLNFLSHWGAQMTITLTIDEKSSVSPSLSWAPVSVFTLATNGSVAADAQRISKMSYYYLVPTLINQPYCATGVQMGNNPSLLVQSDLKLEEWIRAYISTIGTKQGIAPVTASGALKDNVLSQDIKFDITTSGGITPSSKLTKISVNPTGTFLSASRDRTHDAIITFGPGDKTGFTGTAAPLADQTLQLSNAVSTGFRNALPPQ